MPLSITVKISAQGSVVLHLDKLVKEKKIVKKFPDLYRYKVLSNNNAAADADAR